MKWDKARKIYFWFLNIYIATLAISATLFLYIPFYVAVRLMRWKEGVNEEALLSFRGFYQVFKKVFDGVLYPKISFFKKIGYVFVLPFIKGASEKEENPATSIFLKYYETLKDERDVVVAVEYLDSLHRKYTFFLIVTGILAVGTYFVLTSVFFEEMIDNTVLSALEVLLGILGMGDSSLFYYFSVANLLKGVFDLLIAIFIFYLLFHFMVVSFVMAYRFFKEIRTMSELEKFAKESNKLVYLNLKDIHKNDSETLKKLEKAEAYLLESCKMPKILNYEFFEIDDKYLISPNKENKEDKEKVLENGDK